MDYELIEPDEQDKYDPTPFLSYARLRSTDKQERDPLIADAVHYWDGEQCVAAIVTRDALDSADLTLFYPGSAPECAGLIPHSEGKIHETWHWPCGGQ